MLYRLMDGDSGEDLLEQSEDPKRLLEGYLEDSDKIVKLVDGSYGVMCEDGELLDLIAVPVIKKN